MRNLPLSARIYLAAIYSSSVIAAAVASRFMPPDAVSRKWELALLMVLGAAAGSKKVPLIRRKWSQEEGSMSLGFVVTFAAMLRLGPAGGLVVGTFSCLIGCIYPKRQPLYQLMFNVALSAIESCAAGLVFLWLNHGSLRLDPVTSFEGLVSSSLTYFVLNTGCVAVIIALCSGQSPFKVWSTTFMWTGPSYFAGASVAALALLIFREHVATALMFGSPVAYLTYQSYAVYTARAEEKQQHIEELQDSRAQLADLYLATIKSLALAIDAKDQYTHQHILRVQRYAVATGEVMGLSGVDMEGLTTGALLHDIGKLGVPEYVLLKPGRLTDEEFAKIKQHPEIGAAILDPVEFPWPVLPVVKYHHEKWDGTGYPEGLKGEDIPLTARILAVADVYDALTSSRSYRSAWPHEKAIATIKKDSGTHFDPKIVEAFLKVIDNVVYEMSKEGQGPLVVLKPAPRSVISKADEAARAIQRASSELWALYEVVESLSSSMGLQETLEILARKIGAIFPGSGCVFMLREAEGDRLKARAVYGLNQEFFSGCKTLNPGSLSIKMANDAATYLGEYDPDDLLLNSSQTEIWTDLQTALIVPIRHQGEILGTINLYNSEPQAFSLHDQHLMETIGERAALALYNGMLFDRTRSHALTDSLTGLYNVRYLTDCVDRRCTAAARHAIQSSSDDAEGTTSMLPRRSDDAFALLCLDLDSFKPINDNFGHQKGDEVLKELAGLFSSIMRERDVLARYGGDEFVVVLEGATRADAEMMAARLKKEVETYDPKLHYAKLGHIHLGLSIGIACFPHDGQDCATLISTADAQMYRDKSVRKLGQLAGNGRSTIPEEQVLPKAA